MELLESIAEKVISANATILNGAINDSVTTIVFTHAVFSNGQDITIGEETITLGTSSDGGYTFTGCTRGVPASSHADGQPALADTGVEVLSVTGDNSKVLKGIRFESLDVENRLAIDVGGTKKLRGRTSPYGMSWFYPCPNYTIPNGTAIKIYGWLYRGDAEECTVSAAFMGS